MSASTTSEPKVYERPRTFRIWKPLVRILLFIGVLWLIFTRLDIGEVFHAFSHLRPGYLVTIVLVLCPLAVVLRALRWRCLLPGGEHLPLSSYAGAYIIGVLANSLLLGKLGDLVKAKVICDSKVDYGRSLAVVVIDRLLEGAALLLLFAVVLLNAPLPRWAYQLAWIAGFISVGSLVMLRFMLYHRQRLLGVTERVMDRLPGWIGRRGHETVQKLMSGCEALADYRRVLKATFYALAVWGVEAVTVSMFLAAFSIPAPRLVASLVILVVLNFGMLVPISPGSVGIYQLLCAYALGLWGVDRELGFALGIVMQTVLFVPLYLAGLVWILVLRLNGAKDPASAALAQ